MADVTTRGGVFEVAEVFLEVALRLESALEQCGLRGRRDLPEGQSEVCYALVDGDLGFLGADDVLDALELEEREDSGARSDQAGCEDGEEELGTEAEPHLGHEP